MEHLYHLLASLIHSMQPLLSLEFHSMHQLHLCKITSEVSQLCSLDLPCLLLCSYTLLHEFLGQGLGRFGEALGTTWALQFRGDLMRLVQGMS